jgi:NAD(P)H-quinone oxidoreductase subunit 6
MPARLRRLVLWTAASVVVALFVAVLGAVAIAPATESAAVARAGQTGAAAVVFYVLAFFTLAGAALVAFVRNILYSALGLLGGLLGAGSLYVLLSADLVAIAQLLVYVGGVMVLVLFAVMLTNKITEVNVSNSSFGLFGGVLLLVAMAPVLVAVALLTPWRTSLPGPLAPTTAALGDALLTRWLLPFEVASLVLLATLIGAVVIARKELKAD